MSKPATVAVMKFYAVVLCLVVVAQAIPRSKNAIPSTIPLARDAHVHPFSKITNGYVASRGQFPYTVGIFLDHSHFCGGSIIAPNWVLSCAHCVDGYSSYEVHAGAQSIHDTTEGHTVVMSTTAFLHNAYDSSTFKNDVSLVQLSRSLIYDTYIGPVLLIGRTTEQFVGQLAFLSGWGSLTGSDNYISEQLNYVDLTVISNYDCANYYGNSIVSTTICTSVINSRGPCNGDIGGPLVINSGGGATQIGVVSFWSASGCESSTVAAFARVSELMDWIESITRLKF